MQATFDQSAYFNTRVHQLTKDIDSYHSVNFKTTRKILLWKRLRSRHGLSVRGAFQAELAMDDLGERQVPLHFGWKVSWTVC